ncbi:MAG TPA: helix-turn-helix domain-containing protein, partial [Actinomycetota bacterium]|nr:helix-turn-helix domain-containing protein [Actinomycetota bacterium]
VASPRDLGSYAVLLGGQPREALEGFVRSVLGPLIDRDRARSSDLVASVRAFMESGGRWEPGAETLAIHRHTLRYRVRQAEELLGRDLASAEDRMEIWLALKAMEVLER